MTNRQILADYKRQLKNALAERAILEQRGFATIGEKMENATLIANLQESIQDLEGAISMGADDPNGALAGWCVPVQVIKLPGLC